MKTLALALIANRPATLASSANPPVWQQPLWRPAVPDWEGPRENFRRRVQRLFNSICFCGDEQPCVLPVQWADQQEATSVSITIRS
jgi:hypothetical protein